MNTLYLKYFVEVVDMKSFNKAATKLFLNRSSLIAAINSLENEIGYRLLNRNVQGVSLTPKGAKIYQDALKILQQINSWQDVNIAELKKTVHIYSLPAISETLTPDVFSQLALTFTNCNFIVEGISNDMRLMMQKATQDNAENNIIIGGYYDMQKEEFDYLVNMNHCVAVPLYASSHSIYYNVELEKKYGVFHDVKDFLQNDDILTVSISGIKASLLYENAFYRQPTISAMSVHQVFYLISTISYAAGLYPRFLKNDSRFCYDKIAVLDAPDIVAINYCLIANETILEDEVIRNLVTYIVDYAKKVYS